MLKNIKKIGSLSHKKLKEETVHNALKDIED